jgi:serine/threonine-protein kinase
MESTSPLLLKRAIDVCDRFEADWRANCPAPIEHYLGPASAEERPVILRRLLSLEVELRRARGERPTRGEYERRFPQETKSILTVFGEVGSTEPDPETEHIHRALVRETDDPTTQPDPQLEAACAGRAEEPLRPQAADADQQLHRNQTDSTHVLNDQPVASGVAQRLSSDRYSLIRIHAKGGIGEVWLARDSHLGREIAMKRLQSATATSTSAQARFLREARLTGQLQHPGIAPVYELSQGAKDQEPFYTMRLIKGRTLTEAAREYHERRRAGQGQPLDLRELVGDFLSVCQVIAYAHSRGVIHRDIKGQNVVLGDFGEVMVLDWGLAKVVGQRVTEPEVERSDDITSPIIDVEGDSWVETIQGEILGTPSYMSPEQASGRHDLVDQRSDIYGLGALLYELLISEPPFRGRKHDVLRRIEEERPLAPRDRVPGLSPSLEAICLKCLAKAPGDRYSSAGDLAKDVQRYLADEPVTAYKEGWTIKVKRWIGRHRTLAIASTAALLVGTVILSGATISLRLAATREANNLKLAMTAVDRFFTGFGDDPHLKAHGLERPRQALLLLAKDFYEIFAREKGQDPTVKAERGRIYLRLAKLTEELGEASHAIPLSQQACSIFEALARSDPGVLEYLEGFARALDCLGGNYGADNQPGEAKVAFEKAVEAWQGMAREHPDVVRYRYQTAVSMNRLARLLWFELRDPDGSERALSKSLTLSEQLVAECPEAPEYQNEKAEALLLSGKLRGSTGDMNRAKALFEAAFLLREKLAAEHPDALEYQASLVETCVLIAAAYSNAREAGQIPVLYTKIRSISERLARVHPDVAQFAENRCLIEMLYLIHLAQSGEHQRATTEVESLLGGVQRSGMTLLYAACCYCVSAEAARRDSRLSAGERQSRYGKYLDRAMELLRATRETGLFRQRFQVLGLKSDDPDLAPLRGREDFKRFLAELEAETPSAAK